MSEIQLFICVYAPLSLSLGEVEGTSCRFLIAEAEVVEYIKRLELKWSCEIGLTKIAFAHQAILNDS